MASRNSSDRGGRAAVRSPNLGGARSATLGVKLIVPLNEAMMFSKEAIEQRRAYLDQSDAVAKELGKLTIASVRTLAYLGEDGPDGKLLDAIQRNSNEILALQQRLRELWKPLFAAG